MASTDFNGIVGHGVRKVSEQTIKEGRALIITEENENEYAWEDIPNGSLKVNGSTGLIMVKLSGQSNWVPSNVRLDITRNEEGQILDINGNVVTDPNYLEIVERAVSQGGHTLSIAKDAIITRENFTIVETNLPHNKFTYRDENDRLYYSDQNDRGFWFELKKGHYAPGRNMIEVTIDDILVRSAATGGITEISETRFVMPEKLEPGMELTVRYYQLNRIGNPYPRIYLRKGNYSVDQEGYETLTGTDDSYTPENAEIGDIWFDYNGNPENVDNFLGDIRPEDVISYDRIAGMPATVADAAAKGLMTDAVAKGHKHSAGEIVDLDFRVQSIVNDTLKNKTLPAVGYAQSAGMATTAMNAMCLNGNVVGLQKGNIVSVGANGFISDKLISYNCRSISKMVDYSIHMRNVKKLISSLLPRGTVIAWYGPLADIPEGWALCDGEEHTATDGVTKVLTPDLRGRCVMGVDDRNYDNNKFKMWGSVIEAGLPNIAGEIGGSGSQENGVVGGAFYVNQSTGAPGVNDTNYGQKISFSATRSDPIYGRSDTVQPPAVALYYIMRIE